MKKLGLYQGFSVLAALAFSSTAFAGTVTCSASVITPTETVMGFCNAFSCSGAIPGYSLTVNGSCTDGGTFTASAFNGGGQMNGTCSAGFFNAFASPETVTFTGNCSSGGTFMATAYLTGGSVSGTCMENRSFSATVFSSSSSVSGQCPSVSGN